MTLALIDTGCANLASVRFALERLGAQYEVVRDPDEASGASRLILPGVGAADAAMTALNDRGWTGNLRRETRPVLGICLGMQLLFSSSDEGELDLIGALEGRIRRLPVEEGQAWPHMGWNTVSQLAHPLWQGIPDQSRFYFVHSYYVQAEKPEQVKGLGHYGVEFAAAVGEDNVFAVQFHPESILSLENEIGHRLIDNVMRILAKSA